MSASWTLFFFFFKEFEYIMVITEAEGAQQGGDRYFPFPVYLGGNNVTVAGLNIY